MMQARESLESEPTGNAVDRFDDGAGYLWTVVIPQGLPPVGTVGGLIRESAPSGPT